MANEDASSLLLFPASFPTPIGTTVTHIASGTSRRATCITRVFADRDQEWCGRCDEARCTILCGSCQKVVARNVPEEECREYGDRKEGTPRGARLPSRAG